MGVFQISPAISLKDLLELVGELSVEHVLNILTIDSKKIYPIPRRLSRLRYHSACLRIKYSDTIKLVNEQK